MNKADNARSRIFRDGLLDGAICVVSGAGTGLGAATATELAQLGATIIACGRRDEPLRAIVEKISGTAEYACVDIRDEQLVSDFIGGVVERHGRIDVLVNNAGGQFMAPAESISPKGFRTVIELNTLGTWHMTHAAATQAMIPRGGGKIINVTLSPHNGMPGMFHTGAARAAVENMTRSLAVEWAQYGVTVNAVAAGPFATDEFLAKYPSAVLDLASSFQPLGRCGRPDEFAWMIAYLASCASDFITGSVITVDGARDNHYGPWPPIALDAPDAMTERKRS